MLGGVESDDDDATSSKAVDTEVGPKDFLAATRYVNFDKRCDWVDRDYVILLPGENLPINLGIDTLPAEHSGSSIATAIASGLAGLILYLARSILDEKDYSKLGLTGITKMLEVFRPEIRSYRKPNVKGQQISANIHAVFHPYKKLQILLCC